MVSYLLYLDNVYKSIQLCRKHIGKKNKSIGKFFTNLEKWVILGKGRIFFKLVNFLPMYLFLGVSVF